MRKILGILIFVPSLAFGSPGKIFDDYTGYFEVVEAPKIVNENANWKSEISLFLMLNSKL